ncbi:hypothetical protein OUZ56_005463 [Daphnia magna]|uniref:Tc1-like transposase DDE domain-containing protein n=1 Tax=Daphnia magna TaxID=35525 RepID=A0ABQ9YTL2_9CRUS|nr:hypothetical protein OUZ56_005463 [Daphnia magna]
MFSSSSRQDYRECELGHFILAHFRYLQALLTSAYKINNDNLDIIVSLDDASLVDLSWWIHEANFSNGEGLLSSRPDVYLSSDASRIGWDAVRLDIKTRGPWTPTELDQHTVPTPGEVIRMVWPPQSPDLNPIEQIWDHIDSKIRKMCNT